MPRIMPLKLGMLGMWHPHADGIVRRVAEHSHEFSLVAFYDHDPGVVASQRKKWDVLLPNMRVFDSPQGVLNEPLDAVVVEGRVFENVELARLAVTSGRHVLLEKPAGTNLTGFRGLIELAQEKRRHVQMLYLFRYMSAVQEMFRLARGGELGHIYEFRARLPKDVRLYDEHVADLGRYQGGIFFEMAGHLVDMLVTLLGKPQTVTPFMAHHHAVGPADFVDHGIAVFGCERAWGIVEVPALEIATNQRRIEVYGTEGAYIIPHLGSGHLGNNAVQPIDVYRAKDNAWQTHNIPAATLQIADLREFAAVVAGQKPPNFTSEHDLIVHEAFLRACGVL